MNATTVSAPVRPRSFKARLLLAFTSLLLAFATATATALPAVAAETQAVTADKSGILNVVLSFEDTAGLLHPLQGGSGFLINNDHLLTNWHVVHLDNATMELATAAFGGDFRDHLVISVFVMRDVHVRANIVNESEQTDFSILKLEQPISGRTPLKLSNSDNAAQTESVWALGFPGIAIQVGATTSSTYTPSDVSVESGTLAKAFLGQDGVDYFQHSAKLASGNSGGPLVNENGSVIGINRARATDPDFFGAGAGVSFFYAISINQVRVTLDALSIGYDADDSATSTGGGSSSATSSSSSSTGSDSGDVSKTTLNALISEFSPLSSDLSKYTEESATRFTSAFSAAKAVNDDSAATQAQVDSAVSSLNEARRGLAEKPAAPLALIIGIGAAVLVIIVAVIIIVVVNSKKKNTKVPPPVPGGTGIPSAPPLGASTVAQPQQPAFAPVSFPDSGPTAVASTSMYQPPTNSFDGSGSGETTVLNPAVGETSLLGGAQMPTITLRRVSNGEHVRVDRPDFIIGKERRKVNYVIPDNGTISRQHARITQRNGEFFITDLNTTNFTYVNEKKIAPNSETPIRPGDSIKLSDEEFVFEG